MYVVRDFCVSRSFRSFGSANGFSSSSESESVSTRSGIAKDCLFVSVCFSLRPLVSLFSALIGSLIRKQCSDGR